MLMSNGAFGTYVYPEGIQNKVRHLNQLSRGTKGLPVGTLRWQPDSPEIPKLEVEMGAMAMLDKLITAIAKGYF